MFGDVVKPSIIGREQAVVYAPAVDPGARGGHRRIDCYSAPGGRYAADAAVDDGVRGRSAAAAPPATPTTAAAGRGAEAGDGSRIPRPRPCRRPRKSSLRRDWISREQVATVQGDIGGVVGGIPGGIPEAPPPPPPPPAPVRVGGAIQPPKKVTRSESGVSADRAVSARAGRRDSRSDHRP